MQINDPAENIQEQKAEDFETSPTREPGDQPEAAEPGTEAEEAAVEEATDAETEVPLEESELETVKKENEVLGDRLLRTMAEYDNYRKRSTKEKDELYSRATANTVGRFLPVLDNLVRALSVETADQEYKKGVEMIYTSFQDTLKDLQVEEFGELGEEFNPDFHNAVMHVEDEELGTNVVAEVLQKGYRLGDKILRYAMVKTAN